MITSTKRSLHIHIEDHENITNQNQINTTIIPRLLLVAEMNSSENRKMINVQRLKNVKNVFFRRTFRTFRTLVTITLLTNL